MNAKGLQAGWQEQVDAATALRRHLHRMPELPWQEFQTAACIRETLTVLDIPWRAFAETGTIATIGSGTGPHVALRADIDALPIKEESGLHGHRNMMAACMPADTTAIPQP